MVSGLGPAVSLCKGQGRALRQVASGQVPLYRKVGIGTPISSIPGPRSTTISLSLRAKESLEKTLGCNGKRGPRSRLREQKRVQTMMGPPSLDSRLAPSLAPLGADAGGRPPPHGGGSHGCREGLCRSLLSCDGLFPLVTPRAIRSPRTAGSSGCGCH